MLAQGIRCRWALELLPVIVCLPSPASSLLWNVAIMDPEDVAGQLRRWGSGTRREVTRGEHHNITQPQVPLEPIMALIGGCLCVPRNCILPQSFSL